MNQTKRVQSFLKNKPRDWGYAVSLYKRVTEDDPSQVLLNRVPFTDDEVKYIRRMAHIRVMEPTDAIRRDRKDGVKPGNILVRRGEDARLDRLLFDTVEASDYYDKDEFDTAEVDLDEKWYYYRFRCVGYDDVDHKLMEPETVKVCLCDDDYAYLLMQCVCHPGYTFNQLTQHNPQLAAEISKQIIIWWGEGENVVAWPYILIPEEAREDAAVIRRNISIITTTTE